jgi:hypothetical protein
MHWEHQLVRLVLCPEERVFAKEKVRDLLREINMEMITARYGIDDVVRLYASTHISAQTGLRGVCGVHLQPTSHFGPVAQS